MFCNSNTIILVHCNPHFRTPRHSFPPLWVLIYSFISNWNNLTTTKILISRLVIPSRFSSFLRWEVWNVHARQVGGRDGSAACRPWPSSTAEEIKATASVVVTKLRDMKQKVMWVNLAVCFFEHLWRWKTKNTGDPTDHFAFAACHGDVIGWVPTHCCGRIVREDLDQPFFFALSCPTFRATSAECARVYPAL